MMDTDLFLRLGNSLTKQSESGSLLVANRKFKAFFGITPEVCQICWNNIEGNRPPGSKLIHLLWALLFLKVYKTEEVHAALTGVDMKTFRKWSWIFIDLISNLDVVCDII